MSISIIERCVTAAANGAVDYSTAEKAAETALAEFARLAQSPEMVERLVTAAEMLSPTAGADWLEGEARVLVVAILAALFREAGVSGGGR